MQCKIKKQIRDLGCFSFALYFVHNDDAEDARDFVSLLRQLSKLITCAKFTRL